MAPESGQDMSAPAWNGFETIINLAGENIAGGRWTDDQKRKIRDSRMNGTHLLSEAIAQMKVKAPRVHLRLGHRHLWRPR